MPEVTYSLDRAGLRVIDVLLVDDDPGDVLITTEAFELSPVHSTLHVVSDGEQALRFLRRTGEFTGAPRPGLILLDLNLPRRNGLEVLAELKADPKEHAEHLMLLDLARNDVGRVAKIGSVRVVEQFTIEKYSHLQHISSHVEGTLEDGLEAIDALKAGFPAGTLSGAPKVRAMEIIDEVEPVRRGIYAGCAGYFAANGSMDTCILLRTGLVKDDTLYVQAGVGVVADSDLEAEYQESVLKARGLVRAAEEAVRFESARNVGNTRR